MVSAIRVTGRVVYPELFRRVEDRQLLVDVLERVGECKQVRRKRVPVSVTLRLSIDASENEPR